MLNIPGVIFNPEEIMLGIFLLKKREQFSVNWGPAPQYLSTLNIRILAIVLWHGQSYF